MELREGAAGDLDELHALTAGRGRGDARRGALARQVDLRDRGVVARPAEEDAARPDTPGVRIERGRGDERSFAAADAQRLHLRVRLEEAAPEERDDALERYPLVPDRHRVDDSLQRVVRGDAVVAEVQLRVARAGEALAEDRDESGFGPPVHEHDEAEPELPLVGVVQRRELANHRRALRMALLRP